MADKKDFWATPHENGWQVKREGNQKATSVHSTQAAAWSEAKDRAKASKGEAYKTGRDGTIKERNTYGKDPRRTKG